MGGEVDVTAPAGLVSIVTPSLNRARLIEHTIRSVEAQTYGHVEHIVVDGGSTDGTLDLLRRHGDRDSLRWTSEPDDGMYSAINKGLRAARGDILGYLNTDDLYFPWTVEVVVEAFRRHPEADLVYGDVMNIDEASGLQTLAWNLPIEAGYLRRAGYVWQPGVFWRRRVMERSGVFDEGLRYGADLDYWLRVLESHGFQKINEFLAVVRMHPETLSLVHRPKVIAELNEIRRRHQPAPGRMGRFLARFDGLRRPVWARAYWVWFVVQSLVPRRVRRGPWHRLLNDGHTNISYLSLLLRPIPGLGRRVGGPLLRPTRYWLGDTSTVPD